MTECNCCGECCDPVVLPWTKREAAQLIPGDQVSSRDLQWIQRDLTQLSTKEGLHLANQYHGRFERHGWRNVETNEVGVKEHGVFYRCRFFDNEPGSCTYRMCTAHDERPPVCRGFPWYGKAPDSEKKLGLDCSFRADVTPVKFLGRRDG